MRRASKLAIVDKLLPMLEAYGASRQQQSDLRRSMKASACTHEGRHHGAPAAEEGEPEPKVVPCYDPVLGRTPWCEACRQHDQLFARLMSERKSNKNRLQKIERLAVAYAMPEPAAEPERKELFELLHALEQEEVGSAEAAVVSHGVDQKDRA